MIKIIKTSTGDYFQKLMMENNKIIDCECNCKWGQIHKDAWKNSETICKHLKHAILHENLKRKKYN